MLAGITLLLLRGILLWLVVPITVLVWVPTSLRLHRRGVTLGQFLGWVDLNLIALLAHTLLRPLFRDPPPWVPVVEMPGVTHRVGLLDPM